MSEVGSDEIVHLKRRLVEAIAQVSTLDMASNEKYSVTVNALAETLADVTFAALNSRTHAERVLALTMERVRVRWRQLEKSIGEVGGGSGEGRGRYQ